jgi:hypothetical protein
VCRYGHFWAESREINEDFQVSKSIKSKKPRREASESLASNNMVVAHQYDTPVPGATALLKSNGTTFVKRPIYNGHHNRQKRETNRRNTTHRSEAIKRSISPFTSKERGTDA